MGVATMVVIKETIPHLHGGTHQPQILRDTVDHQHQIQRIPGIVAHQIIVEMLEARHQKGTWLKFLNFYGSTLVFPCFRVNFSNFQEI